MRRQTPIAHLLYSHLYPSPSNTDPPSFSAHLARNLVPEVRVEVATFYGDLNSVEARYPGLNYCHPPHRMRLGRFKHHKRLFAAFDALGLTCNEIQDFCCWEGTKWARERYEKDEGVKVLDTTGDEIGPYVDRRDLKAAEERRRKSITRKTDISVVVEDAIGSAGRMLSSEANEDEEMSDAESEGEEEDAAEVEEIDEGEEQDGDGDGDETPTEAAAREQHVSEITRRRDQSINQRIVAAYGNGQSLPPEIEQYLKEESERGTPLVGLDVVSFLNRRHANRYISHQARERSASSASVVVPRAAA